MDFLNGEKMPDYNCNRCGACCMGVGKSFWLHVEDEVLDEHPELKSLAEQMEGDDAFAPCFMLEIKNGIATCLLEQRYGRDAKPHVCRNYPDDEECDYHKGMRGTGKALVSNDTQAIRPHGEPGPD